MKFSFLLIGFFLVISCSSTKYNIVESNYDFSKIQAGTKYTFFDRNDRKLFIEVTSVEKDSIRGLRKKEPFAIAKNDIKLIRRNRTGATVILISGVVGVVIVSAVIANTFGKIVSGLAGAP